MAVSGVVWPELNQGLHLPGPQGRPRQVTMRVHDGTAHEPLAFHHQEGAAVRPQSPVPAPATTESSSM